MTQALRLLLALASWQAVSLAQSGTGIVEGRVVSVQNNEGVARAEVILGPARINQDKPVPARSRYSAETDSRGNFSFTGIAPGQYQVTATHPNFGSQAANQFPDPALIPRFVVSAGQRVDGVVIRLTPLGVIAGRILDADGDPVSNAQVEALQSAYQRGVARLASNHSARSDDHGEYRLFGLFPGPYIVRATGGSVSPALPNLRGPKPPPPYSLTYFGDTTDSNRAAPLEVQGSGELRGIDIHLQREELFSVKGKYSTGWPAGQNRVAITVDKRPNQDFSRRFGMRIGESDYEISQLPAGSYAITGRVADPANPAQQLVARRFVEVSRDLDGVDLSFSPGEDVSGVVTATGSIPSGTAKQRILLQPVEPGGGSYNSDVGADGTFAIRNLVPDLYQVRLDSPVPAYIASIKIGSEELPGRQLDLRRGGAGRMAIVLSREYGRIEGKVTDAQGAPVVSANVTIVPDQTKADWPVRFDNILTDSEGRYLFLSVIPDSYRVYAWRDAPRGAPQDAAFRKPFEQFATPVEVQPDTRATIDLKAITTQDPIAKP